MKKGAVTKVWVRCGEVYQLSQHWPEAGGA